MMENQIAFDIETLLAVLGRATEFWSAAERLVFGDGTREPCWEHQWTRRSSRKAFRAFLRREVIDKCWAYQRPDGKWWWNVDFAPHGLFQVSYALVLRIAPDEARANAERALLSKAVPIAAKSSPARARWL